MAQEVPIASIVLSRTNPRQRFEGLEELAQSIQSHGVLQPLLVRPTKGKEDSFTLIAGERRLRAAKAALLETVPCIVRELSDAEVVEIQVIENLQRSDLHALEEADGYSRLLGMKDKDGVKYDVAKIAARIGRSVKYVYDRVKLLELTPEVREVFLADAITPGHAIQIARLTAAVQKDLLKNGLWREEELPWEQRGKMKAEDLRKPISVRELGAWIDDHVRFDPGMATAEPLLFPETAKVVQEVLEKEEKLIPITYEYHTPDSARTGSRIIGPRSWKRADGKEKSKKCDHSGIGVVAIGPERSETFRVCTEKDKCKVHWVEEQRERKRRAKDIQKNPNRAAARMKQEEEKRKAREAEEKAAQDRWVKAVPAILEELAIRVKKAPARAKGFLADCILVELRDYDHRSWDKHISRGTSAEDFIRWAAFTVLARKAANRYWGPKDFPKTARALGFDVKKILDAAAPPEKKAAPAKTR